MKEITKMHDYDRPRDCENQYTNNRHAVLIH